MFQFDGCAYIQQQQKMSVDVDDNENNEKRRNGQNRIGEQTKAEWLVKNDGNKSKMMRRRNRNTPERNIRLRRMQNFKFLRILNRSSEESLSNDDFICTFRIQFLRIENWFCFLVFVVRRCAHSWSLSIDFFCFARFVLFSFLRWTLLGVGREWICVCLNTLTQ